MKDEVFKANDQLMLRGEKVHEMENKAQGLAQDCEVAVQRAKKVNKTERKRRGWIYIAIILVILAIIYGIICLYCHSFVFEC